MTHRNLIAALLFVAGAATVAVGQLGTRVDAVLPVPIHDLGLADNHAELAAPVAAQMPRFFVVGGGDQENERKNVRLWEYAKLATGGRHIRNFAQETGDCVSQGTRNAAEYYLAAAIGKGILDSEYHEVFPPYTYGGSRVTIGKGKLGRSPGSVGAWAAEFTQRYGVLRADAEGVPAYSGRLADEWGVKGPPKEFVEAAKMFTFDTIAPITTAADARDAICNGYPVTIASDFGTNTIKVKDNRRVAVRNARWPHQMCLIGYDGSASQPYWYCINSWGESAHPSPLQGEPPGGFWITQNDVEYIVRQGDSFAYSGFDGFPAQEFVPDFSVIGAAGPPADAATIQEAEAMFPLSPDVQLPVTFAGAAMIAAAVALLLMSLRGNRGGRLIAGAAALMMALPALATAQDHFSPDFALMVTPRNSPAPSTSGRRTGNEPSTAAAAEYAPDFALLALTANAPHDAIGGIRADTLTEPPAVDFATLSRAACDACTCSDCLCAECDGKTCTALVKSPFAEAKPQAVTIKAYAPKWCSTCPQWKLLLGAGDDRLKIEWLAQNPPAGAGIVPAFQRADGQFWDWGSGKANSPTLAKLKAWAEKGGAVTKQAAKPPGHYEQRLIQVGRNSFQPTMVWVD